MKKEEYYIKKINNHFKDNKHIDIIEFVYYEDSHTFAIKICIYDDVYLFNYSGTIDELIDDIESELEKKEQETGTCPFCGKKLPYIDWVNCEQCENCEAIIIHEISKPNSLGEIIEDINGLEIISNVDKKWKIWFIEKDKIQLFNNINDTWYDNKFIDYINNTAYNEYNLSDIVFDCFKNDSDDSDKITTLSKDYIYRTIYDIGVIFCNWISNTDTYEHIYNQNEYDNSGELEHNKSNRYFKIKKFENVYEWLNKSYTGNYTNTYCSGYGRSYDKISDSLYDKVREYAYIITLKYYKCSCWEDLPESSDSLNIDIENYLMDNIFKYFEILSPIQFWKDYSSTTFLLSE